MPFLQWLFFQCVFPVPSFLCLFTAERTFEIKAEAFPQLVNSYDASYNISEYYRF
jgi:hypothetical protein